MHGRTQERVPAHLRRHVVEQDYGAYTAVDQAVWRFILLQLFERLRHTAHPAYVQGLSGTGMAVDRIPRIEEMDARLGELGWGAVCVDGFIPPRAFQEFQALGILPIAAEIRRVEHLPYTPAPDIVHEAAGHAPILPDPAYARFLRRIGELGTRAFSLPVDARVYDAIRALSVAKERRDAGEREVRDAEQALDEALADGGEPSEAGRLARLYWWTVEYGLVGRLDDYRLYGAGLLSSLGESHFCHAAEVQKVRLDASCADVGYDITSRQPQLFVAEDFEHLEAVLDEVCAPMAFRRGGLAGLRTARASGEVATVELGSGLGLVGVVADVAEVEGEPALVRFAGRVALTRDGRLEGLPLPDDYVFLLGRLEDGSRPERVDASRVDTDGRLQLRYAGGAQVTGRPAQGSTAREGVVELLDAEITPPGGGGTRHHVRYPLVLAGGAPAVRAGAVDARYWPAAEARTVRVPVRTALSTEAGELLRLYEEAEAAHRSGCVGEAFARVHRELQTRHRREWLLRWNLLESLQGREGCDELRAELVRELRALEHAYGGSHPIASGLRYLGYSA